jgi:hypothetical protein
LELDRRCIQALCFSAHWKTIFHLFAKGYGAMKTLGRALLILAVFALMMGITYVSVTAGTSGSNLTQFQRGDGQPNFANGQRPEFPGGERNEDHDERGGGGLMFGIIKNTLVITIVVMLIVLPKAWLQRKKRIAQVAG